MIVIAALLVLFTCWAFWGWCVGDSRNIRWIRHWCGGIFVIMVAVLSAGSGFLAARVIERGRARDDAFRTLQTIADRLEAGQRQRVIAAIRAVDHRGDPDEDAFDLLEELPQLTSSLSGSRAERTAVQDPDAALK